MILLMINIKGILFDNDLNMIKQEMDGKTQKNGEYKL